MLASRPPSRAVQPVRGVDRLRIDGGRLVGWGVWDLLGHAKSIRPCAVPRRRPYCAAMAGDTYAARGLLGLGDRLALLSGVVLTVSAFTGWYTGSGEGVTISVTGWNVGTVGKLVFVVGVVVVALIAVEEAGVRLPAALPESLITIGLGAVATILVLVRVITIPDDFFFADRGIGIWISLVSAVGVIVAGLLQASEEL